jgi:hypothetical protein
MLSIALIATALLVAWFVLVRARHRETLDGDRVTVADQAQIDTRVARPQIDLHMKMFGRPPGDSRTTTAASKSTASALDVRILKVPDQNCACEGARLFAGRTFEFANAPTLPLPGCGLVDCRCSYERIANRRHKERRQGDERRDSFRFETKVERRKADRRKQTGLWKTPGR